MCMRGSVFVCTCIFGCARIHRSSDDDWIVGERESSFGGGAKQISNEDDLGILLFLFFNIKKMFRSWNWKLCHWEAFIMEIYIKSFTGLENLHKNWNKKSESENEAGIKLASNSNLINWQTLNGRNTDDSLSSVVAKNYSKSAPKHVPPFQRACEDGRWFLASFTYEFYV